MTQDRFFMAKSGNTFSIHIQDEELLEYITLHHQDDQTKILHSLDEVGGRVVGDIVIPDTEIDEEEQ